MEESRIIKAIKEEVAKSYTNYIDPQFIKDIEDSIEEVKEGLRNGKNYGQTEFRVILWNRNRLGKYRGMVYEKLRIIEQAAISLFEEVKKEYQERL